MPFRAPIPTHATPANRRTVHRLEPGARIHLRRGDSSGWSGYLTGLLDSIGHMVGTSLALPPAFTNAPLNVIEGRIVTTGALVNLPAVAIVIAVGALCYRGITQSASVNAVIVAIKVVVLLLFMAFSLHTDPRTGRHSS
jgi:amino acid transporter